MSPVTRRTPALWLLLALAALVVACGEPTSGPVEISWGRDACSHCRMILSDRRFAAQIRLERSVERFDDLGCALAWLADHPEPAPREIWVHDEQAERWLDARTARYRTGRTTPMGFGLGARAEGGPLDLDFDGARRVVEERERDRARRAHDH